MSGPCLFTVVGLCNDQNNSSSSLYEISLGSYFSCMASACPVLSVQTSSYVGFVRLPPVYPTLVDFTPLHERILNPPETASSKGSNFKTILIHTMFYPMMVLKPFSSSVKICMFSNITQS